MALNHLDEINRCPAWRLHSQALAGLALLSGGRLHWARLLSLFRGGARSLAQTGLRSTKRAPSKAHKSGGHSAAGWPVRPSAAQVQSSELPNSKSGNRTGGTRSAELEFQQTTRTRLTKTTRTHTDFDSSKEPSTPFEECWPRSAVRLSANVNLGTIHWRACSAPPADRRPPPPLVTRTAIIIIKMINLALAKPLEGSSKVVESKARCSTRREEASPRHERSWPVVAAEVGAHERAMKMITLQWAGHRSDDKVAQDQVLASGMGRTLAAAIEGEEAEEQGGGGSIRSGGGVGKLAG